MTYFIIIIAAFAATTQMTIFSYAIARLFNQPYDEPFLLAILLNRFGLNNRTINRYMGWGLHYFLGLLFVIGFQLLLDIEFLHLSWMSAIAYGIGIGIIGIIGWQAMFRLCRTAPKMEYLGFYIQLFFAHIIFSLVMVVCYKMLI